MGRAWLLVVIFQMSGEVFGKGDPKEDPVDFAPLMQTVQREAQKVKS